MQAHLTLIVLENGRVTRVEHAHLQGQTAARVLQSWPPTGPVPPDRTAPSNGGQHRVCRCLNPQAHPRQVSRRFALASTREISRLVGEAHWLVPACLLLALACLATAYLVGW